MNRAPPPIPLPKAYGQLAIRVKAAERDARASLIVATVALLAAVAAIVVAM